MASGSAGGGRKNNKRYTRGSVTNAGRRFRAASTRSRNSLVNRTGRYTAEDTPW